MAYPKFRIRNPIIIIIIIIIVGYYGIRYVLRPIIPEFISIYQRDNDNTPLLLVLIFIYINRNKVLTPCVTSHSSAFIYKVTVKDFSCF
jgi:hypothetical protein